MRGLTINRLRLCWWGHFWRGWLQWGSYGWVCADKDSSICARSVHVGPLEFQWWNDADWQRYCFTPAEAAAFDAQFDADFPGFSDSGDGNQS